MGRATVLYKWLTEVYYCMSAGRRGIRAQRTTTDAMDRDGSTSAATAFDGKQRRQQAAPLARINRAISFERPARTDLRRYEPNRRCPQARHGSARWSDRSGIVCPGRHTSSHAAGLIGPACESLWWFAAMTAYVLPLSAPQVPADTCATRAPHIFSPTVRG